MTTALLLIICAFVAGTAIGLVLADARHRHWKQKAPSMCVACGQEKTRRHQCNAY